MEMSKYRLPEHCPGPPALPAESSGNETSDNDLGMQLRRKDEELQQLKTEVQSYAGKLKGYQTLGEFVVFHNNNNHISLVPFVSL